MSYIINGPTIIGDVATSNTLEGSLFLPSLSNVAASAAVGDLMYCDNVGGNGHQVVLPIGTAGQVLTVVAGVPAWATDVNSIDDGFSAMLTANQLVPAATATNIGALGGFTSTAPGFDTTGGWGTAVAGLWTVTTTGKYHVSANVSFTDALNSGTRTVTLRINGTDWITKDFQPTGNNAIAQTLNFSTAVVLTAADTVAIQVNSTNGTITVLAVGTNISMVRYSA